MPILARILCASLMRLLNYQGFVIEEITSGTVMIVKLYRYSVMSRCCFREVFIVVLSLENVTGPTKIDHVSANYTKLYFR